MMTLTIPDLPEATERALRDRATRFGRSVEDEARKLLEDAVAAADARLKQSDAAVEDIRSLLRAANGGVLPTGVVDEFLAERRAAAAREDAEYRREGSI